jgi:hypothetical protein
MTATRNEEGAPGMTSRISIGCSDGETAIENSGLGLGDGVGVGEGVGVGDGEVLGGEPPPVQSLTARAMTRMDSGRAIRPTIDGMPASFGRRSRLASRRLC